MDSIPYAAKLIDQGTLGVMLVISLITNTALFRLLLQEKDKRLTDSQTTNDKLVKPISDMNENVITQNTLLRQILGRSNNA